MLYETFRGHFQRRRGKTGVIVVLMISGKIYKNARSSRMLMHVVRGRLYNYRRRRPSVPGRAGSVGRRRRRRHRLLRRGIVIVVYYGGKETRDDGFTARQSLKLFIASPFRHFHHHVSQLGVFSLSSASPTVRTNGSSFLKRAVTFREFIFSPRRLCRHAFDRLLFEL